MRTTDKHIDPGAQFVRRLWHFEVAPAINLANAVVRLFRLGVDTKVLRAAIYTRVLAGAVSFQLVFSKAEGILVAPTSLAIATVTTSFRTNGIATFLAAGIVTTKAATDNLAFTAAHQINQNSWGAILVQIDAAGAVTTKVTAAIQAGFATEAQAIAALPAPDALKVYLGHITVRKTDANFVANTTALNAANTTVNYYVNAPRNVLTGALVPVAGREVLGVLSAIADRLGGEDDEYLALLCTTDGTGALTDGHITVNVRPETLRRDRV